MPRLRPAAPTYVRALALIEQLPFRFALRDSKAKKPHIPHEYTARDKQDAARETAYFELFRLIQADGEIERWLARPQDALPLPRRRIQILDDDDRRAAKPGAEPNA